MSPLSTQVCDESRQLGVFGTSARQDVWSAQSSVHWLVKKKVVPAPRLAIISSMTGMSILGTHEKPLTGGMKRGGSLIALVALTNELEAHR